MVKIGVAEAPKGMKGMLSADELKVLDTDGDGDIDIEDGTVDGDNLTWKASMTSPMPMTLEFTATVSGDEINGEVKLGAFGNATFTGTRA